MSAGYCLSISVCFCLSVSVFVCTYGQHHFPARYLHVMSKMATTTCRLIPFLVSGEGEYLFSNCLIKISRSVSHWIIVSHMPRHEQITVRHGVNLVPEWWTEPKSITWTKVIAEWFPKGNWNYHTAFSKWCFARNNQHSLVHSPKSFLP